MVIGADEQRMIQQWRLSQLRKRMLRLAIGYALLVAAYCYIAQYAFLAVKMTESIEGSLFIVVTGQPLKKHELAMFEASPQLYRLVGCKRWTKYVVGFPGDVISHRGRETFVNGESVGVALERSTRFPNAIPMTPDGVIPPHYYFVTGTYERSLDSRYQVVGLIHESAFIGRAYRLF